MSTGTQSTSTRTRDRSNRRSSPVFRLALAVAGIGVVLVVAGIIAYQAFRSSRSVPISVTIYPDAELVASAPLGEGHDRWRYVSSSPAEEVGQFYSEQIGCQYISNTVQSPDVPAFQYTCIVDGSSFFITQYTVVTVQPGVGENAGRTLIDIERFWGR